MAAFAIVTRKERRSLPRPPQIYLPKVVLMHFVCISLPLFSHGYLNSNQTQCIFPVVENFDIASIFSDLRFLL